MIAPTFGGGRIFFDDMIIHAYIHTQKMHIFYVKAQLNFMKLKFVHELAKGVARVFLIFTEALAEFQHVNCMIGTNLESQRSERREAKEVYV